MLHRDISTNNIFLDFDANVLVGDLGLAKRIVVGATSEGELLAESAVGTPDFLSPELVRGEPYGRPSDGWAVGVILFNLLTLHKPFEGANLPGIFRHIAEFEFSAAARKAAEKCGHPPELRALASSEGLLNPDASQRMPLERVLELYPLPEE